MSNMFYEYRVDLARSRGIRYTSPAEYRGDMCQWECHKGHSFEMSWKKVVHSTHVSCPKCKGRVTYSVADYSRIAAQHGGECIKAPARLRDMGKWRCAKGHEFPLTGLSVMNRDVWCTVCSGRRRAPEPQPEPVLPRGRVKLHELLGI